MDQKINLNIFQLSKTKNWQSKYFEKTSAEIALYSKKDLEIRKFALKFFKFFEIAVHECKLSHFSNDVLYIYLSYHQNFSFYFLNSYNKTNISFAKTIFVKNHFDFQKLKLCIKNNNFKTVKKALQSTKKISVAVKYKENKNLKTNYLLNKFIKSLTNFNSKELKLFLVLQQINNNIKKIMKKKSYKILKKIVINLKKFAENEFFQDGISTLFTFATNKKSAKLLAEFIAIKLKKLKQHNYFLKFLETALTLLNCSSFCKFKGIKIKIKGKLNGRSRAVSRIINLSQNVPILSVNSNIIFAKSCVFTIEGVLGVKVWINEIK